MLGCCPFTSEKKNVSLLIGTLARLESGMPVLDIVQFVGSVSIFLMNYVYQLSGLTLSIWMMTYGLPRT
jgi:cyclopropane fatty-acyl-phospholipid synthase-like methyltransferase